MKNSLLLAGVLWREAIRSKLLWLLALAGCILVLAALILGEMVVGRPGKAIWDLGLSVINLLSLAVVIFFGTMMSSSEIDRQVLQLLLVKPLSRRQFFIGVFITLMLLAVIASLAIALLCWALLGFTASALPPLLSALFWNLLEMSVMSSVTLFCSALSSPQLAIFLSFCFYIIGHSLQQAMQLTVNSANVFFHWLVSALYLLLPNLSFFNQRDRIATGLALPSAGSLLWAVLYAGCCVLIWGWLAEILFTNKEM